MKSSNAYLKYVDMELNPDPEKYVIASYLVQKAPTSRLEGLAFLGAIAAESSTGTWIDVQTNTQTANKVAGKVFYYCEEKELAQIAYPLDLFEPKNLSQLLTVLAGNAFGLADIQKLKLMDISLPSSYLKTFKGPKYGIEGVYQKLNLSQKHPIIGSIIKPKCGLTVEEHAQVCYDAWIGMAKEDGLDGVDMVKDDEALTHQEAFQCGFYKRMEFVFQVLRKAEDKTGKKKIYIPNITSSNILESLRRAEYVKNLGGDAVMIDYVMGGGTLLHTLREADMDLIIHGHRTLFAALHRSKDFGINYLVWAKLFRMIGGDQVHSGTPAIGVMSAIPSAIINICNALRNEKYTPQNKEEGYLPQDFSGIKPVLPICGAGLDPLTTPNLTRILGNSLIIFAGGGIHGHPQGTKAGAASLRASIEALSQEITIQDFSKKSDFPWLTVAINFFQKFDKQSPNSAARENL